MSRQIDTSQPITAEEAEYLRQRGRLTEDIEVEGDSDGDGEYQSMSIKELRKELKSRELDFSKAKKAELIARLEADDEDEGDDEEEEPMTAPPVQTGDEEEGDEEDNDEE